MHFLVEHLGLSSGLDSCQIATRAADRQMHTTLHWDGTSNAEVVTSRAMLTAPTPDRLNICGRLE